MVLTFSRSQPRWFPFRCVAFKKGRKRVNIKSHRGIRKNGRNAVTACVIAAAIATCAAPDPARYNVIWDSPSADCHGSMPLGNGEIGLNVWTLADGSLHLLISKTDAWDEHGRLVKVGEVVVRFDPAVFKGAFRQELDLKTGSIVIQDKIRVWVDAHHPVVRVTTDLPAQADLALWRTNRIELTQLQTSDIMNGAPAALRKPVVIEPDVLVEKNDQQITWYHHNVHSGGPALLAQIQGLAEYAQLDPLADRIFGARLIKRAQGFDIVVLTQQPSTASRWLETLTTGKLQLGSTVKVRTKLGKRCHFTILGKVQTQRTGNLLHRLGLCCITMTVIRGLVKDHLRRGGSSVKSSAMVDTIRNCIRPMCGSGERESPT
jgi:hypothetical protein